MLYRQRCKEKQKASIKRRGEIWAIKNPPEWVSWNLVSMLAFYL